MKMLFLVSNSMLLEYFFAPTNLLSCVSRVYDVVRVATKLRSVLFPNLPCDCHIIVYDYFASVYSEYKI